MLSEIRSNNYGFNRNQENFQHFHKLQEEKRIMEENDKKRREVMKRILLGEKGEKVAIDIG